MREFVSNKWDVKECRGCEHAVQISEGAKNVKGDIMTPEDYWFTVRCDAEGPRYVQWQRSGQAPEYCPYKGP